MTETIGQRIVESPHCETCLYWSDLVASATGGGPLMALCEHPDAPKEGRMTSGQDSCPRWEPTR